ncbi:carbohydrate porin [Hymenobacter fodinae]|uniref:Carbohydrate porin n=1 Tax=Hymenobacter fodinae TaxID=2510796 RepID=A0A4Z0P2D1_9BACT|nr:carbohydrate porin [Hymenobacter fodinae]TGE05401.1 carbohydrate porin [Hymenobacter fodinae]
MVSFRVIAAVAWLSGHVVQAQTPASPSTTRPLRISAGTARPVPPDTTQEQPWSLHFQQTLIDQWHAPFSAPYSGAYSLAPREKAKLSFTSTAFIGRRLWSGAGLYLNPEVAGGSGLSGARGIAGFTNGETFRIGNPAPQLYLARLYLRQVWALGGARAVVEDGPNQLGGTAPQRYLALNLGKISIADFFDQNSYSHDPRTQFFNWSLMSNGAWDYPANTRGYTVGAVAEYVTPAFALRAATTLVPKQANGPILNYHYGQAHSETLELTRAYHVAQHPGLVRLLAYRIVANMGSYRQATALEVPDITATRAMGRTKTGLGLSAEQQLTPAIGAFGRVSYNDGKHETWAFTEIDRSASLGLVSTGTRWHRPDDRLGLAVVANGLSAPHRNYLAAGGYGFIIGDGKLNYSPEMLSEVYYSLNLSHYHAAISPDYQFVLHPAYNRDRGPVSVAAVRLHVAF